jgi:hypothetical protein
MTRKMRLRRTYLLVALITFTTATGSYLSGCGTPDPASAPGTVQVAAPQPRAEGTRAPSPGADRRGAAPPAGRRASPPPPTKRSVSPAEATWSSWAVLDRRTGAVRTGGAGGTNSTESMIKAWIVADYLDGVEQAGREPTAEELDLMRRAIRVSDNAAAQKLYKDRGGDPVVRRLIDACGLTDTTVHGGWWSLTEMSARDAARMGDCIADGRVTTPRWTAWLVGEMRQVTGEGRFGPVEVRPVDRGTPLAIKNGWTRWWNGTWHVNCLAVADGWSVAVMVRYPASLGLQHGAEVCRTVSRQVLPK